MCTVSMIGDHYNQTLPHQYPWTQGAGQTPGGMGSGSTITFTSSPTHAEFEALKKEVENMKALLIKAKIYDEVNNQKDCEMEEKVKLLKDIAKLVGVDLTEVFGNEKVSSEQK